ncbi:MAG: T9SS type A sorting domain-containing protein [Saprospiraceae bacterium]|nr:T9SS type A sorting domain-containing protein [Saprospiraceae bacterium]
MKKHLFILIIAIFVLPVFNTVTAQTTFTKKVVLQGFWWDYWNSNYPGSWANYLADLAPRLKSMDVDAIWIPPSVKNSNSGCTGIDCVGYSPFDHYDLGDKFQKSTTGFNNRTRLGTKDELLRMIAVMHANGIEVIQDIVLNHCDGASVQDPEPTYSMATAEGYKNFRYACYETPTPATSSGCDYMSLKGRWTKNYSNFHPHLGHNSTNEDWTQSYWGPDICYGKDNSGTGNGYGQSSNCTTVCPATCFDPTQSSGYMRDNARNWMQWMTKQTSVDGFRFDAVKHFPHFVTEDLVYNTQNNSWASKGDKMFAVGEWVGSTAALDAWTLNVGFRAGTFDFNLRAFDGTGGLYSMINDNGGFDMGNLPGAQQSDRYVDISSNRIHRTVPFINNHDTYRPTLGADNKINGWSSSSELSPHVPITEPRLASAYAVIFAMDGNPQVFFEDLLNIANTGNRYSHLPTNTTDLPANSDIVNIMQCNKALDFKSGIYKVRSGASMWNNITSSSNDDDILVIERSAKALICITDNWNTDQDVWVDSDFPAGTVLKDYSGGVTTTTTVGSDQRVNLKTKAVGFPSYTYSTSYADHGAQYHGYSIWAPNGMSLSATNPVIPTSQEWEMSDDLGDSNCSSLTQGGSLPLNSCSYRIVGKVYVEAGTTISYECYPETNGTNNQVEFYNLSGVQQHCNSNTSNIIGSFTAGYTGWFTIKIRHTGTTGCLTYTSCETQVCTAPKQKMWVKITYTAPATLSAQTNLATIQNPFWTGAAGTSDWSDCKNWEEGRIGTATDTHIVIPPCNTVSPLIPPTIAANKIYDIYNQVLPVELVSFYAKVYSENTSMLTWTTMHEQNNKGFSIEKSEDGINFQEIGFVASHASSYEVSNYQFIDTKFFTDAYYRLVQWDIDGKKTASRVIFLNKNENIKFIAFPNPTDGNFEIIGNESFDRNTVVGIAAYDILGVKVYDQSGKMDNLVRELNDNLSNMNSGTYLININYKSFNYQIKLVKL